MRSNKAMPLTVPDEVLQQTGMNEEEARVEIACRLFDAGRLTLWSAAQWLGLSRVEIETQLLQREISIYRPTSADLAMELEAFDRLGI
jgi:predicted HTH domain antitoxin